LCDFASENDYLEIVVPEQLVIQNYYFFRL